MNVRAIALAVPLALGMACMHTQQGATGSAPAGSATAAQPQAAGSITQDPIIQPGPAIQGHAGDEVVAGRIADLGGDTVSIETQQGDTRMLQVVPETAIQVDGQDASVQDLAQGQEVYASFDVVGGQEVAVKIHAGQLGAAGTGSGSAGDQGSTPGSSGAGAGSATPAPSPSPPNTGSGQGASGPPASW